jgi:hypothetical protein
MIQDLKKKGYEHSELSICFYEIYDLRFWTKENYEQNRADAHINSLQTKINLNCI